MATTVAVDANGADLGPAEVAAGALEAAGRGVRVLLFGPAEALGAEAAAHPLVEVVDAPVSIAKAADPARAARATPDASIVRAAQAVGAGEADALVSGGSTGAALAAALFNIKRAPGVHRPALAVSVPVPEHPFTLLDAGANAEVRAEHLVQFAFMGAAFTRGVLGVESPRVGLLSNGEEATKGTALVIETHELLAERVAQAGGALRFVGNVEGTDVTNGAADVVVTDGFTGNIVLKLMEGVSRTMIEAVRDAALASPRGKAGGLLLRPSLSARARPPRPGALRGRLPARPAQARRRAARALLPRAGSGRRSCWRRAAWSRRGRPHARGARGRGGAAERARGVRRGL